MSTSGVTVWDKIWTKQVQQAEHDPMSFFIALSVLSHYRSLKKTIPSNAIEMGAGPGRSSRYLNDCGVEVGILDYSAEAIELAKKVNRGNKKLTEYYLDDLFKVSPETLGKKFDLVWNAGVLEHFDPQQQTEILSHMASVQTKNGMTIVLTPYADSLFYRFGKWLLEILGKFPYGQEIPVRTLTPVLPKDVTLMKKEISVGFLILIFNGFKALSNIPGLSTPARLLQTLSTKTFVFLLSFLPTQKILFLFDRILSKVLGGYLLMTILTPKTEA